MSDNNESVLANLSPEEIQNLAKLAQQANVTSSEKSEVLQECDINDFTVVEEIIPPKQNYSVLNEYSKSIPEEEFDYGATETAFMPSGTVKQTSERIKDLPKAEIASSKEGKEWLGVVSAGIETNTYANGLVNTVLDKSANFEQSINSEIGALSAGAPAFKVQEGTKFSGEKARLRVRQSLKLGVIFNIPLWHSGFWIRIKAPQEAELLELYRQITSDKITLGRATYGLLFSNNTSYATRALLDFCVDCIYETSLDLKDNQDIRQYIKTPDLPILFWGLACSVWPNGFQYMRACIADAEKCNHVIKAKLDLSKLQFTNTSELTKRQITHMTKRNRGAMSLESIKLYQDEFIKGQARQVSLNEDVKMTLQIPDALEHIDAGYRWINAIEENYGRALIQEESKRDNYLISQGKATVMRQYGHFVKEVNVSGEIFDDQETIEGILDDLTASDEIRDKFLESVAKYLDDSVISLIAIPTFKCPNCQEEQKLEKEKETFPGLIPIDVNNTFFTLLVQRIQRIEAR